MSNTLNDLQLKLTNEVAPVLEEDRYFGYLLGLIGEGENEIDQQSVTMHKTVDEEWLSEIEGAMDSIFKVIQAPRRCLKNNEEVVPVDLARKITADSVRHLSQNTQFIASNEDGNVQPTRVLNVTVEETYDLYENRFIYHLIQRLVTFVDKRTDVIFWSTGDEKYDSLKFHSKFQDESEEVEYELSLKIKNRHDNSEEKKENMDVFMRIDRLRRQIVQLRRSSFCEIMHGCSIVRSPIQRTNLIMKDHDYRKCYQLWQFIERYDGIGYTIDEEKKALQFDEDYLYQFYDYIAVNYANFKSILSPDKRAEETVLKGKKKTGRKPKFIKSVKEEFVDSPNIEEVELRKVFVEFVTQAQLDAEAKAAEAVQKAEEAEARAVAAEEEAKAKIQQMKEETDAIVAETKATAEAEVQKTKAEAVSIVAATKAAAEKTVAETKANAEAEIADAKSTAEKTVAETKAEADRIVTEAKADADEKCSVMEAQMNSALAAKTLAQQNESEAREQAKQAQLDATTANTEKEAMRISMDAAMAHADEALTLKKKAEEAMNRAVESAQFKLNEAKALSEHAEKTKAYAMTQIDAANKALAGQADGKTISCVVKD
ncbi:MAG: DUF2357 domain-containing protein, partial [Clostridia bacterium]|nr:DUF2357 domain-containing protein [Clostridia bacterium]